MTYARWPSRPSASPKAGPRCSSRSACARRKKPDRRTTVHRLLPAGRRFPHSSASGSRPRRPFERGEVEPVERSRQPTDCQDLRDSGKDADVERVPTTTGERGEGRGTFRYGPRARSAPARTSPLSPLPVFVGSPRLRLFPRVAKRPRSEEHTSELQSQFHLVCRLLLEKKKKSTTPEAASVTTLEISFVVAPISEEPYRSFCVC